MRAGNSPGFQRAGMPLSESLGAGGSWGARRAAPLRGVEAQGARLHGPGESEFAGSVAVVALAIIKITSFLDTTALGAAVLLEVSVRRPGRSLHEFHRVPLFDGNSKDLSSRSSADAQVAASITASVFQAREQLHLSFHLGGVLKN